MDIRLKERLVGAVVLVVAAVIFIPMLLDGPSGNRRISQRVPLPATGGETPSRRTVRIDLESGNSVGVGDAEPEVAQGAVEPVSVDLTKTEPDNAGSNSEEAGREAIPTETGSTANTSSSQPAEMNPIADAAWSVQAGSFSREANADGLAKRLREAGHGAYVSEYREGDTVRYRVRVGGYPDRERAEAAARELRQETGGPARPVPVD